MVDAATGPIKQAQTTYDAGSQANQQNVTGLSAALASILGGIGPGVKQTYEDASARQAAFAQGFSQHMQDELGKNATNTSSFLQNIVGAPSSQIADTAAKTAPGAASDTLYGIQGYIPASTLNEEGAAYTANAQQLPGIAHSQGLQQIAKIQADQAKQDADFAQQIGSESGKAPQYARQLQTDAFDQAYKTRTLKNSEANTAFNQNLASAKFSMSQRVDAFNQKYKLAGLNLRGQSLQLQATKFAQQTLQSDRSYGIALAGLGLRTKAAQQKAIADEYKLSNGGLSVQKINELKGDAAAIAADTFNGFTDTKTNKKYAPLKFGQALTEMRKGAGNGSIPLSVALKALQQAGFNVPKKYNKLMGGSGQAADPFASTRGLSGHVSVASGANRPGTSINPQVTDFVAQIAGVAGVPLTITTGTNHNEYVAGSHRVSDHWDGNASDIAYGHGSPGHPDPALTKLGQDALIAAGMPVAQARKQTGGLFNIGNKQIIFNSMEGGNHFNHLHVGVR